MLNDKIYLIVIILFYKPHLSLGKLGHRFLISVVVTLDKNKYFVDCFLFFTFIYFEHSKV